MSAEPLSAYLRRVYRVPQDVLDAARYVEVLEQELAEAHEQREKLADALDSFFYDLRYTAPECVGQRVGQLGDRITPTMLALGYPKKGQPKSEESSA